MATLEELEKRKEESLEAYQTYTRKVENQLKDFIETLTEWKVIVRLDMSRYEKRTLFNIKLLNSNGRPVFGGDIDIEFMEYTTFEKEKNQLMQMNYSICGRYSRIERNGALKEKAILIGKLWQFEKAITKIYLDLDWQPLVNFDSALSAVEEYKQYLKFQEQERKQKEHQAELDEIIKEFKVGYVVKKSKESDRIKWQITIDRLTAKQVYLSHYTYLINSNKKIFSKNEVAEYILKQRKEQQNG